jgi:hypothetical protein
MFPVIATNDGTTERGFTIAKSAVKVTREISHKGMSFTVSGEARETAMWRRHSCLRVAEGDTGKRGLRNSEWEMRNV